MHKTKSLPHGPRLDVVVTQQQIDEAIRANSGHCMIADSISTLYPQFKNVSVDIQTIRVSDPRRGLRYTYLTPRIAQVHLVNWDEGNNPEPYNFQLRKPQVTLMHKTKPTTKETTEQQKHRKRMPAKAQMRRDRSANSARPGRPLVVGGDEPPLPQMNTRREFGVRLYRGAKRVGKPATPETQASK